jgi:predicted Rossmann fold flavoprotein
MSNDSTYDVIVVGGGPAGMMAAGKAASRGLRVLLLEKNEVLGTKLSITGGGRCNITNLEFDVRTLLKNYGDAAPFLFSPFSQFSSKDTAQFFAARGLPFIIEDRKRAFPKSEKATDVTKTMEAYVRENGVEVRTKTPVRAIHMKDGEIVGVLTDNGVLSARAYVIASGGTSRPETGSTGDGMSWLASIGHTVAHPNPDLVPLVVKDAWVRQLSGTTLTDVRITFKNDAGSVVLLGNVLCTHFGLSGPLVINAARKVKKLLTSDPVPATVDLFPHDDVGTLRAKMHEVFEISSNKTLENALAELIPKSLVNAVLEAFPLAIRETKTHSVSRETRYALVERMKALSLIVTGTKGLDWAIVSDGGVDLREIDTRTMQSKLHSSVYLVGDMLNVPRPSGGFSLQLCWTTGFVAGENVCR